MVRKIIIGLFLLSSIHVCDAQLDFAQWTSMACRNIGPAGMSGRITAVDVDIHHDNNIYIGSASGGVWYSDNSGTTWRPIFDDQENLSIGSIKINQKNPDEIWVGTGEGNPRNSMNMGKGIYKSIDGGKSWKNMGLQNTKVIHRITIDPMDGNVVYAAAMGNPWVPNEDRGVFKTTDGGKTWKKILFVNDLTGAADMVMDPSNPNKLIVAMWQYQRQPWYFNSGGSGSGLYITYDGGEHWEKLTVKDGMPKGDLGRMGLTISASNPDIIYALIEAKENGLYKSSDGGKKWSLVSDKNIGDRPFYYSEIYADPKNENTLYNLFTYVTKSIDGGKTFKIIADYGNRVHPDHHAFWIHPEHANYLIDGNDGGLNISKDGGENWQFVTNIPVGQFYHINYDTAFPYNIYGGLQDNGSWVGPSGVLKHGGIRNSDFQELYFGDGFDVVPLLHDPRYGYAMSQGGNVGFYDKLTGKAQFSKPLPRDTAEVLRFNWNSGIAKDPFNDCGVYFGSQFLHYSDDCGLSWVTLSEDLTTNDKTKQKADQSGGLTLDATFAENYTTILCIEPSKWNANEIWVGTDDGNVQKTTDKGKTWVNLLKKLNGLPTGSWISQIVQSDVESNEWWIVANNYRRGDDGAYVYHTIDGGKSFDKVTNGNQIKSFVLSIAQDHEVPNLVFLGTDNGLYISFDRAKSWQSVEKILPHVQVSDLKIHPMEDDLIIATFGRAVWIWDDINPLRDIAKNGFEILKSNFKVLSGADGYLVSYRSFDGIRFSGQGEFIGQNRNYHAANINIWLKPDGIDNLDKVKIDTAVTLVYDMEGNLVRTFSAKLKNGLNKITWDLKADGVAGFDRKVKRERALLPSGSPVLSGRYKAVVTFQTYKDSTFILVKDDPRLSINAEDKQLIDAFGRQLDEIKKVSVRHFEDLKDAKAYCTAMDKLVELLPPDKKSMYVKIQKDVKDTIDQMINLYLPPENQKGIQRNPNLLSGRIAQAENYVESLWRKPQGNATNAIQQVREMAESINMRVDAYLKSSWLEYLEKIRKSEIYLFDNVKRN